MSGTEQRLAELGLILPTPAAPVANYVPFVRSGNLLFVSGQLPFSADGRIAPEHTGQVGAKVSPEAGHAAARLCAINILAQVKAASGSLDHVRCVRRAHFPLELVAVVMSLDFVPAFNDGPG